MQDDVLLESFRWFVRESGPRVKQALIASFGGELGRESASEALVYAWEHWERISGMGNPAGYVYRVGRNLAVRSRSKGLLRIRREGLSMIRGEVAEELPMIEPALLSELATLSENQRTSVVLVHGFGWTLTEVAALLGVSVGSVQKHSQRGLVKLRRGLGAPIDA